MNYTDYHTLSINGARLSGQEIIAFCRGQAQPNIRLLGGFITEWLDTNPVIEVKTSGSTGSPKIIRVKKNQMLQSAAMTAGYFDFRPGETALLCLPMTYIAGKMMVVRALYSRLDLVCVEPDSSPLAALPAGGKIDFAPMVPMQLEGTEDTAPVRKILLGGGPVSPAMEEKCQSFQAEIYHGYGMTETLSHVALRRLNGRGRSAVYHALPGITFSADERNCLIIDAPFIAAPVITNDVTALINEKEFLWKGRIDYVVNSGGVKLFPEEVEKKLSPLIREGFFVAGLPDARLGEKLCLFIEGRSCNKAQRRSLLEKISGYLDKYEKPRDIFFIDTFNRTSSGKINRKETIRLAREQKEW